MPPAAPPVFRAKNKIYRVDSCGPQLAAIRAGQIEFHALTQGHYPGTPLKIGQLRGVQSLGFLNGGRAQQWGSEAHRNEGVEISFLETGSMGFTVEAKDFKLRSGQFSLTRPWQPHKLGDPYINRGRFHWVIIDVGVRRPHQGWRWPQWVSLTSKDRKELTRLLQHNEFPVRNASPEIAAAFQGLAQGVRQWGRPLTESQIVVLLNRLLVAVLEVLTDNPIPKDSAMVSRRQTVNAFLEKLGRDQALCAQPWTLKSMAEGCAMGITSFSQYGRASVNCGPMEFLNQCRLEHAARQLATQPGMTITELALQNGFNSSQYFATAFRRHFHSTPRDYRTSAR